MPYSVMKNYLNKMNLPKGRQRSIVVLLMLLWCLALITFRVLYEYDPLTVWLGWNLILASVPLLFSAGLRAAHNRKQQTASIAYFILWLLFLPNSPYIITDLIHVVSRSRSTVWYDLAMTVTCAGVGLMLGYYSLIDVHKVIDERFGRRMGWIVACSCLMLSGFGVYLGRFLRFNSWNAITNPFSLLKTIVGVFIHSGKYPHPIPVTIILGVGLILGYLALRVTATE